LRLLAVSVYDSLLNKKRIEINFFIGLSTKERLGYFIHKTILSVMENIFPEPSAFPFFPWTLGSEFDIITYNKDVPQGGAYPCIILTICR